ncbi:MAG: hypothetical protein HY717_15675 [Planctomycetes bacterium]|nr:hypothetical protein [Planctomycetota bacterium]
MPPLMARFLLIAAAALAFSPPAGIFSQTTAAPRENSAPAGAADDPHVIFSEANRRFEEARSDEDLIRAAEGYRRLLDRGLKNSQLYYNLGNTYLRLRDHGQAILNFRRALLYQPDHAKAIAMLEYARQQVSLAERFDTGGESPILRTLFFWHYGLAFSTRLEALILALLFFWILLAARLFTRLPYHRFLIAALLAVAIALGVSLGAQLLLQRGAEAVIVAKEAEVRSGNGPDFDLVFKHPLPSGIEVKILESRAHWHFVEFPGGVEGWILASAVEEIGD